MRYFKIVKSKAPLSDQWLDDVLIVPTDSLNFEAVQTFYDHYARVILPFPFWMMYYGRLLGFQISKLFDLLEISEEEFIAIQVFDRLNK